MRYVTTTKQAMDEAVAIAHEMTQAETWLQLGRLMQRRKELQEQVNGALETGYFKDEARDELKTAQFIVGTNMDRLYFEAHKRISRIRKGLLAPRRG